MSIIVSSAQAGPRYIKNPYLGWGLRGSREFRWHLMPVSPKLVTIMKLNRQIKVYLKDNLSLFF